MQPEDQDDTPDAIDEEIDQGDEIIDEDLACLRCQYNLRGLKTVGRCPECGASVGKAVAFARQRILCPTCLQPNHPMRTVCQNCTAPLNGAAATSTYWKATPSAGRRVMPHPDDEPSPPNAGGIIFFGMVGIVLLIMLVVKGGQWLTDPGPPLETPGATTVRHIATVCFMLVAGVGLSLLIVFPARHYLRGRREFIKQKREWEEKHPEDVGGPTEPEEELEQ